MAETKRFVGIDVAKAQLNVFIRPSGESFSVANDEAGIRELLRRLQSGVELVILWRRPGVWKCRSPARWRVPESRSR